MRANKKGLWVGNDKHEFTSATRPPFKAIIALTKG